MKTMGDKEQKNPEVTESKKPVRMRLSKKVRMLILISGIVLTAAALGLIVYAVQSMIVMDKKAEDSLSEVKQIISEPTPAPSYDVEQDTEPEDDYQGPYETADPAPTMDTELTAGSQTAGEPFGYMIFDTILDGGEKREVAIIEGTTPDDLDNGAGHYIGFSYPGENGNSPIFGHRTTVFKDFDKLEINDIIKIVTNYGTFIYQIVDMQITEPMAPIMFKVYDEPMVTLVTCYPFIYAGHAPQRYVVICKLIDSSKVTIEY